MASRQEEKERRRQERLAQEEAERRAASRSQRMRILLGAALAVLIAGGVAFAIASGGGGGGDDGEGPQQPPEETVELPAPQTTDLQEAVKAAGCELEHPKYEGAGHEERAFTPADYKTNPPTSGNHFPRWYEDGIYDPGEVPDLGQLVHTLEHGRINVQYKPGTPANVVDQLESFAAEKTGYHILLYENTTDMPYEVAATAWTHLVGCETFKPEVIDVLRTFYDSYVDKGPEPVP